MRHLIRVGIVLLVVISAIGLWTAVIMWNSLPLLDGIVALPGLTSSVSVTTDEYGVPTIEASSRTDAFRVLGYVMARDRLFQMDLLRRGSAGQLAEIIGETVLSADKRQRVLGFNRAAHTTLTRLPRDQRDVLEAFAQGVNAFLSQTSVLPFEFYLLGYRPEPWQTEDCLLVTLAMFQALSLSDEDERMRTVMTQALPAEVAAFLTPDSDPYTEAVLHGTAPDELQLSIPVDALLAARRPFAPEPGRHSEVVRLKEAAIGSNGWVVNGAKTENGKAILANDMHWDMGIPNIWYRVRLRYAGVEMVGIAIPGIPVVIAGANSRVAWGLTNIEGDFVDLVRLELNPHDRNEYKTPNGWRRFDIRREVIKVKGELDVVVDCRDTIWGPVADQPVLGHPVAVRWTALDPDAIDIGLLYMDRVQGVSDAIDVVNHASGPPNNVLLADVDGHIGWTYTGKIPIRRGFDGAVSVSWADGQKGWAGYIAANDLPRIIDPPSGFIVSANQRMLDNYPHIIGHSFVNGYRAYRIVERLQDMRSVRETHLFHLQLDTKSEFYEFYRRIARDILTDDVVRERPSLAPLRRAIDAWNGHADTDSLGYGLLVQFRKVLAKSVFTRFLVPCFEQDQSFAYGGNVETPLRALLITQVPGLSPVEDRYHDWRSFLIEALERSAQELQEKYSVSSLAELTWGRMNHVKITHPLSHALPGLGYLLNMPEVDQPGCGQCVRVMSRRVSASERLVVSPGHLEDGILHMPGGQSGHPFSPHYRDQQPAWSEGIPLPFSASSSRHAMTLVPSSSEVSRAMS